MMIQFVDVYTFEQCFEGVILEAYPYYVAVEIERVVECKSIKVETNSGVTSFPVVYHNFNAGLALIDIKPEIPVLKSSSETNLSFNIDDLTGHISTFLTTNFSFATVCSDCDTVVSLGAEELVRCTNCKSSINNFLLLDKTMKSHIAYTVEQILKTKGIDHRQARKGKHAWAIQKSDIDVEISYFEQKGILICESKLCSIEHLEDKLPIFTYLLNQNYYNQSLVLSAKNNNIFISQVIQDTYLSEKNGLALLEKLFTATHRYSNILINEFKAISSFK